MKHHILFVDDEQNVLKSIKRSLNNSKYHILTALGAAKGLEIVSDIKPSVIITDMKMPEIAGGKFLELAQQIHPHAIYMVLSGHSDISQILDVINNRHVWRYINKPWKTQEITIAISWKTKSLRCTFRLSRAAWNLLGGLNGRPTPS